MTGLDQKHKDGEYSIKCMVFNDTILVQQEKTGLNQLTAL